MDVEDRELRPLGGGRDAAPCASLGDTIPGALQELYRALHCTSIYPPGHPAVRQTIERASNELAAALRGRGSTMVGIARDHLIVDRVPLEDSRSALVSLAQFLHALDVAVVEFRSSVTAQELERFLFRVRDARQASRGGTALAVALAEEHLESIRIFPLDYWGLSFSTHADRERQGATSSDLWDGLVVNLAELARPSGDVDPEALADEANRRFVTDDGVGNGLLREQMRTLGRSLPGMDDWQREALRARVSRFVGALNPNLRQDLLRLDPRDGDDAFGMMAELSDTLPDATLLDVLRDINRAGHHTHDQFLNFLNKMSRIPSEKSDTPVNLESVLRRWRVAGAIEENPTAFRSALKEVLSRKKAVECNPDKYQDLLDELSHREVSPAARIVLERYRDPSDAFDVRCQAVELAVHLLADGDATAGGHAAGLLAHVGAATDELLDAGRFQPVRDAAVTARAMCSRGEVADEARRAAACYLRDFTLEARVDRILAHAFHGGSIPAAVEPLLALGGVTALQRIVDRLDTGAEPAVAGVLQNVAVAMGRGPMAQLLAARSDEGWARLRPTFPVVRLLPAADAAALFESLLAHPEVRVRREALLALCDVETSPAAVERHLRRALHDRESWIVTTAIDRLAAASSDESLTALAEYLVGPPASLAAVLSHSRRVCRALRERGDDGIARLTACLDATFGSVRPAKARVAAVIHAELAPLADRPGVARCLGRWRRSPVRFVSRLVGNAAVPEDRA